MAAAKYNLFKKRNRRKGIKELLEKFKYVLLNLLGYS
jgi:hypothetical protein